MPWTVYGFFKLSTYFGHEKTVSYNHSKGIKAIPHSGAAGNTPFENRYFMGTFLFWGTFRTNHPSQICSALWDGIPRRLPDSPNTRSVYPPFRFITDKWVCRSLHCSRRTRRTRDGALFFCLENTNICAIMNTRTLQHNSVSLARFSALTGHEQNKCCKKRENSV